MKTTSKAQSGQKFHAAAHSSGTNHGGATMVDNRPVAIAQRQLADAVRQSPRLTAQRQQLDGMFGRAVQRQEDEDLLQGKLTPVQKQGLEEEEPLQGRFAPVQQLAKEEDEVPVQGRFGSVVNPAQLEGEPATVAPNNTGLPDSLKFGIENLSGLSMDDVKVHYNSGKPSQLHALAYTQGTEIHVAPGQEEHLSHEAWHVAQQKQGRVRPTTQMQGTAINDDAGLEKEADVMGLRALATGKTSFTNPEEMRRPS